MKTKYQINRFVDNFEDESLIPFKIARGIEKTIEDFITRNDNLDDKEASRKTKPDAWSPKEIIGHLIDSASNNLQRCVRAQYQESVILPPYDQVEWVKVQHYNSRPWKELLLLWKTLNLHLACVISQMPVECLHVLCTTGTNEPVSVGYITVDYLGHMQHHLNQTEQN